MQLKARIEDIRGKPLVRLSQFNQLKVIDPLNNSATASVTVSMQDPAVLEIHPLKRVLSITYGDFLVFRGRMTRPIFDFGSGTVQINAHDPTLVLKNHYHVYGDQPVEYGYPVDGIGLRMLAEAAVPKEPAADAGAYPAGFLYGYDTTTHQPARGEPGALWPNVQRGTQVWESIVNLSQVGPDFWFRPVDNEHTGVYDEVPPGFYCELDTFDKRGEDRADLCNFEHNFGKKNAENVVWEPDGSVVRNLWVEVYPGGERGPLDDAHRARVMSLESQGQYGVMMGFESAGQQDTAEILHEKAVAWVRAYAFPPDYFTVTPAIDRDDDTPLYRYHYNVGDVITARAKRGHISKEVEGRIMQATLSQVDFNSNTRIDIECTPNVDVSTVDVTTLDN